MVFQADTFLVKPPVRRGATGASPLYATDVRFSRDLAPPQAARRGVKRLGLAYERRVLDVFSSIYGGAFLASPVIYYHRLGERKRAIPDGLLYLDDMVVIVEVKLAHTEMVWDQLIERYRPLVKILHPTLIVRTVEVCRSYDPAIDIPHTLITSLHRPVEKRERSSRLEVMQWRI